MFNYPEKSSYLYTMPTSIGDVVIRFKQATAEDTSDYSGLLEKMTNAFKGNDIIEYKATNKLIYDNLWKFIKQNIVEIKVNRFYHTKRKVLSLVKGNLDNYYEPINSMLHITWKSVYTDLPTPITKEEVKKGKRKQLFQNNLEAMAKSSLIPLDEITNRLTTEQIGWWHDKFTYDYYETFDEGKRVNSMLKLSKGLNSEQQELLAHIKSQRK